MTAVKLVVVQFDEPVFKHGFRLEPLEPVLAVVQDVPEWEAVMAMEHGTIPSRMYVLEVAQVPEDGGYAIALSEIAGMYMQAYGLGRWAKRTAP